MCDYRSVPRFPLATPLAAIRRCLVALAGIAFMLAPLSQASAESTGTELIIRPPLNGRSVPSASSATKSQAAVRKSGKRTKPAAPLNSRAYLDHRLRTSLRQVNVQTPSAATNAAAPSAEHPELKDNPCAAMDEKPLGALGIGTAAPDGKLPDDFASACWEQLNTTAGPLASIRCWSCCVYNWNATCLCHRPLYFEQINLERHGYGCCEPLQPLASAAHFFGTVPALPYCMAVEWPCECVYTLGHYRPGSCPPWRHHWPPCSPLAAASEAGVWTGMVFLIP